MIWEAVEHVVMQSVQTGLQETAELSDTFEEKEIQRSFERCEQQQVYREEKEMINSTNK